MHRALTWISAIVLVAGIATVPSATAQQTTTTSTTFQTTCRVNAPSVAGMGGPMDMTPQNPVNINVTAPETVNIGDTYQVQFRIDPINISLDALPSAVSLQRASRLKLDLARPYGTELVSASITGGNLDVSQARVLTVNESGQVDPNGTVYRLTDIGHNTIGNGPNSSTTSHGGLGMNLSGATALDMQFPTVTLTLRATRAGQADIGVRTAGAAGSYGNDANFLTLLASATVPLFGTQWVPTRCSPRATATAGIDQRAVRMNSTTILGIPTTTTLSGPDTAHLRQPVDFTATVSPNIAGEVTFVSGSQRVTVPVDTATGTATASLTFNSQPEGPVTATFYPANAQYSTSTASRAVTVEAIPTTMTLQAPATTNARTRTPVTAVLPADARGTVTFTAGGVERTATVGTTGTAATSFTFAELGDATITAVYTPSSTSPYAPATAERTLTVLPSVDTTLVLSGLDEAAYVADPVRLEATVGAAENTTDTSGTVEFVAGTQRVTAPVVDGKAVADVTFSRPGPVQVTATYLPATGSGQTRATDSGTLEVLDAVATSAELVGPAQARPSTPTPYTIVMAPTGASGTATVRIDGRVVATDVPVVEGEAAVQLTFPPSAVADRAVTIEFTPADPRIHQPSESTVTVRVAAEAVDEDTLRMAVTGPTGPVDAGTPARFHVAVTPLDPETSPDALDGYLTVMSNGEPVLRDGRPLQVPVADGVADLTLAWTTGFPREKVLTFTYHSPDGTARVDETVTVTVIGPGGDDDVIVDPPAGGGPLGSLGSLDLGSLMGGGGATSSLTGSLSGSAG